LQAVSPVRGGVNGAESENFFPVSGLRKLSRPRRGVVRRRPDPVTSVADARHPKRGRTGLSETQRRARGVPGASRRSVLVEKGPRCWGIPKGIFRADGRALDAARREFAEETGAAIDGEFRALTPRRLKSGKLLHIFAIEGDVDAGAIRSNLFSMEWPPRSGKQQAFPEVDRGAWFALDEARLRIH
jgi:predicted NUDIX family NTP pyrophosphohydrolase